MASEPKKGGAGVALAIAILVLLVGVAGGVALDRLVLGGGGGHRPHGWRHEPDALIERYRQRLSLDADQARKVETILRRRFGQVGQVFERVDPELDRIRDAGDEEVRALLRPDQRAELDRMRAEFAERRAQMRKRLEGAASPAPPPAAPAPAAP